MLAKPTPNWSGWILPIIISYAFLCGSSMQDLFLANRCRVSVQHNTRSNAVVTVWVIVPCGWGCAWAMDFRWRLLDLQFCSCSTSAGDLWYNEKKWCGWSLLGSKSWNLAQLFHTKWPSLANANWSGMWLRIFPLKASCTGCHTRKVPALLRVLILPGEMMEHRALFLVDFSMGRNI